MQVTLDMADAMELEQLLDFTARWMKAEHEYLAPSMTRFLGIEVEGQGPDSLARDSPSSGSCSAPPTARAPSPRTRSDHPAPAAGAQWGAVRGRQARRRRRNARRADFGRTETILSAAIRICPLAAAKNTPWPLQSVTGLASRRTAPLPRAPI
jgi:hypothetical protein